MDIGTMFSGFLRFFQRAELQLQVVTATRLACTVEEKLDKMENNRPFNYEAGNDFAKRMCDGKYGEGNWRKGAGNEYSKIQKYGDTHFKRTPLPDLDPSSSLMYFLHPSLYDEI